jgi:hypothetical protein
MAVTTLTEVNDQIMKFWAPTFVDQLKETTLLPALVNKSYEGEIKKGGDTVRVSMINRPTAELKTIGVDASTFNPSKLTTTKVDLTADKRIIASFEFEDLVDLQSQIGDQQSKIRQVLIEACEIQLNNHLYSLVAPSSGTPDHVLNGVTDFNATALLNCRKLAATAKWPMDWYLLTDPSYYNDLLNATTLTSNDWTGGDAPVVGGKIGTKRFGFNIFEDNSAGLTTYLGATSGVDCSLAFHPDFMMLAMQAVPQIKVSDLHSSKKFGYVISVDFWCGAKLGLEGNVKHIWTYNV